MTRLPCVFLYYPQGVYDTIKQYLTVLPNTGQYWRIPTIKVHKYLIDLWLRVSRIQTGRYRNLTILEIHN